MLLNTSLNGKGQPIVESPLQAIDALFRSDGNIAYLYLGLLRIAIKPLPFKTPQQQQRQQQTGASTSSALHLAPSVEEAAIKVRAARVYLSEVTTSLDGGSFAGSDEDSDSSTATVGDGGRDEDGGQGTRYVRVRIQDGRGERRAEHGRRSAKH